MNKQEELKSAEEILDKYTHADKGLFDNRVFVDFDKSLLAMEEYADQFKKQLEYKDKLNKGLAQTANFYRDQIKEKEEEIDKLKSDMKIKCNSYDHLHETNSYNFTKLCELQLQLTKSNEMAERLAVLMRTLIKMDSNDLFDQEDFMDCEFLISQVEKLLTEYQNSKK